MQLSPDATRLVCLHCNGDVSVWRLPLLKAEHRWPLDTQPLHDLRNPLSNDDKPTKKDPVKYYVADVNWWSGEASTIENALHFTFRSSAWDCLHCYMPKLYWVTEKENANILWNLKHQMLLAFCTMHCEGLLGRKY